MRKARASSTIWAWDHSIDVVIFTARAAPAGGDIVGMKMMYEDTEMFDRSINEAKKVVFGILDCEKVIIAKVNGDAIGLGATMALFCIIFAADYASWRSACEGGSCGRRRRCCRPPARR